MGLENVRFARDVYTGLICNSHVVYTTRQSPISPTDLSQSLPAPLPHSYYLHLVVFPPQGSVLGSILFTIYTSPILLQWYPLTVSINSNMLTIPSFLSSLPLHLYLAVSAAYTAVCLFSSQMVHPQWSGSKSNIQLKLKKFALAPAHDFNRFPN